MGNAQPETIKLEGVPAVLYKYTPANKAAAVDGCQLANRLLQIGQKIMAQLNRSQGTQRGASAALNETTEVALEEATVSNTGSILLRRAVWRQSRSFDQSISQAAGNFVGALATGNAVCFALAVVVCFMETHRGLQTDLSAIFERPIDLRAIFDEISKVKSRIDAHADANHHTKLGLAQLAFSEACTACDENRLTDLMERQQKAFDHAADALIYAIRMIPTEKEFECKWLENALSAIQVAWLIHTLRLENRDRSAFLLGKATELINLSSNRRKALREYHKELLVAANKDNDWTFYFLGYRSQKRNARLILYDPIQSVYFQMYATADSVGFLIKEPGDHVTRASAGSFATPPENEQLLMGKTLSEVSALKEVLITSLVDGFYNKNFAALETGEDSARNVKTALETLCGVAH